MNAIRGLLVLAGFALVPAGCDREAAGPAPAPGSGGPQNRPIALRVGHFPNVTHAQALVAHARSRMGEGWFERRLGAGVAIEWSIYNAGPSAMEAVFANSIDLTYVGPSPALNAYVKSRGEEIRIIAGAAVGGAALVVRKDGPIRAPADFRGKKVATPQLGNTQDVACRAWLIAHGFKVTQLSGDVSVVPTSNPDQLNLFRSGSIDAVWTVEPWVSRLEVEAGGRIFLEESETVTTVLVASARFLGRHRELARKFAEAHAELTEWIRANPAEAQRLVEAELKEETTRPLPQEILSRSWNRLKFTSEIRIEPLETFVIAAKTVGFLRDEVDLSRLVEVPR